MTCMFNGIEPQAIVWVIGSKGAVCIDGQTSLINKGAHT